MIYYFRTNIKKINVFFNYKSVFKYISYTLDILRIKQKYKV